MDFTNLSTSLINPAPSGIDNVWGQAGAIIQATSDTIKTVESVYDRIKNPDPIVVGATSVSTVQNQAAQLAGQPAAYTSREKTGLALIAVASLIVAWFVLKEYR